MMWEHKEKLIDEHIPKEFTFKTRNREVSRIPNSPRFIFNPTLNNRKTTTAQTLAEEASLLQKKKTFEEIVPRQFHEYKDVFDKSAMDALPPSRSYDHHIRMKDTYEPKRGKVYPLSPEELKSLDDFLDEHLKKGTIVESQSPQSSPFFFIKKKDGSLRPVQDYRYLNEHTIKNAYPLPRISDLFDKLKDAKIFTKMDIRWGYNNVLIHPDDRAKAAFVTPRGLFEPTVMFFGLCNAPATFQAMMNDIFGDMIAEGWLVIYMDDLLIFSDDATDHDERTKRVLQRLRDHSLSVKPEKCAFNVTEVEYLGMIIRPGEIAMDKVKLDGVTSWPTPKTLREVRAFLGFANFYRKFIGNYSNLARPLIDLTKKDTPFIWTNDQENAFLTLKSRFIAAPVLRMPDQSRPFTIAVDASLHATGGVLMQKDGNGDLHPCSYLSTSFSPAEKNYQIYDRELLAIIRALETWRHYLLGSEFPVIIHTDHKNLTYYRDARKLSPRQSRWQLLLSQYDLIVLDALSRRIDHCGDDDDMFNLTVMLP